MSKLSWIYCLRGNDGSFYYGSTTKGVKERYYDHKTRSKHFTEMKVYKHFNALGWHNVKVETIEEFEGNRRERIQKENEYIMPRINDELCLNAKCSCLTTDEKKEHQKEAQKKYADANRDKRKQQCLDYYYKKKYGMTEVEYKSKQIQF